MTADRVLIYGWQTETGMGLMILGKDVVVASSCCNAAILSEEENSYRIDCTACKTTLMPKANYSPSFPVEALRHARAFDYWHGWGEFWFGWKQFNIEAEWK